MNQASACRVVHMSTVHRPFDVRIFHKQCISLARAGYDVALIQQGSDQPACVSGVKIVPMPTYRSRWVRMTLGVWRTVMQARRLRPHIVHFHDVELAWGAVLLKLSGVRVIYDVHEDVVKDLDDKAYLPSWTVRPLRGIVHVFESAAALLFDKIVGATSAICKTFDAAKPALIRNTPILHELHDADARPYSLRANNVLYAGGLAELNNVDVMVEAMALLPRHLNAKLILAGRFNNDADEQRVRNLAGWKQVDYRGWIDRRGLSALFSEARCGLVIYRPSPNVIEAEPNKIFELLSAGLPIVASNFPIWRDLVERLKCGVNVDPLNPVEVAAALDRLFSNPGEAQEMGEQGRNAVLTEYNWSNDEKHLLRIYSELNPVTI